MYRAGLRDDIYRAPADDQHMVRTIGFTNTPRNWLQIKSKAGMSYRVCLTDTAQEIAKYLYDLDLTRNFIYKVLTNWDFYRDQIFTFVQKEITRELLRRAEKANVNEKLAEKIRKELTEE